MVSHYQRLQVIRIPWCLQRTPHPSIHRLWQHLQQHLEASLRGLALRQRLPGIEATAQQAALQVHLKAQRTIRGRLKGSFFVEAHAYYI